MIGFIEGLREEVIDMVEQVILLGIGLTIANFIFEGLTRKQWSLALDRSIFQAIALFVYVLLYS